MFSSVWSSEKYKRFVEKVKKANYSIDDIWWCEQTGFICFPPMERKRIKQENGIDCGS